MRKLTTLALAGAVLATAAAAPPADAAQVLRDGNVLVFRGNPGETNHMSVSRDTWPNADGIYFSDRTDYPITLGPGADCTLSQTGFGRFASCEIAGIVSARIEGGDRDDELDVNPHDLPFTQPVVLDGGAGNDHIEGPTTDLPVIQRGGEGDDKVYGGQGSDPEIDGGPGNDVVDGNHGDDQVFGGAGDDLVTGGRKLSADRIDGGPGHDLVDGDWYDPNDHVSRPLTVTMDGVADDGRPGEHDNVLGIEAIETHMVATLVAGGDPVAFSVTNTPPGGSRLVGSPQNDRLRASSWDDVVDGGGGADAIAAGGGNDTITGGAGPDVILADGGVICDFLSCSESQQGNDTIEARDGERDQVDCGPGVDVAHVDPIDVTSGCENLAGPGTSQTGDQTPGGTQPRAGGSGTKPGRGGRAAACVVPKVRRGSALASVRRRLTAGGCTVKVRRVRSKVRKGRVVSLNRKQGRRVRALKAGTRLAAGTQVLVTVSRGRR